MSEVGRPRIEIDWNEFQKLCRMQCTREEIAAWFGCSEDTVGRRVQDDHGCTFQEMQSKWSHGGKASLRRAQWAVAESGHVTMLIWLGKQYLGQKDKTELSNDADKPVVIKLKYDVDGAT